MRPGSGTVVPANAASKEGDQVPAPVQGAGPVPSPCVNICRMEAASGLCEGCLRTIDEIAAWSRLSDDARRAVWVTLVERRAARVGRGLGTGPAATSAPAGGR